MAGGVWGTLLALWIGHAGAGQVRVSFLNDDATLRATLDLLSRKGFDRSGIDRFSRAVTEYYSSEFLSTPSTFPGCLSRLPAITNGFYLFQTMQEVVGLLDRPLGETEHAWDLNCFDAVIALTNPQFSSRIGVDEFIGPILVPHTTTNGTPLILPVATAGDAFVRVYPEAYRSVPADLFPGSSASARIALTAAMHRVHLLRIRTEEHRLGTAVMESLRHDWRQHRLRFPRKMQVVMCHLVYFPGQWVYTTHAGVLVPTAQGYTYLEKAGPTGPFVRIDLSDPTTLMSWFRAQFTNSASRGYTHLFVTYGDKAILGQKLM